MAAAFLLCGVAKPATAQTVFPNFPAVATESDSATPVRGVSLIDYHTTVFAHVLYEFYVDSTGRVAYGYSGDGSNFTGGSRAQDPNANYFYADTNAQTGDSAAAVASLVVGSDLYLAYIAANTHVLTVLKAVQIPGSYYYMYFQQVYQDPLPGISNTSAGMAYNSSTGDIYMITGTNRNSIINEAYTTHCVASTIDAAHCSAYDANMTTPTQPGLAFYHGTFYMVQKIDGGGTTIFVNKLDANGRFLSGGQISGSGTSFRSIGGFSMLAWNNELIFATVDRDNSNAVDIYASTDGTNWSGQTLTNRLTGSTPGLGLFNSGLTVAYRAHDTRYVTYALHSTP
ncbi:hypothetical protein HDF16_006092 [Granulicella aggregans]|uniref:Exo-alpha-sialidase n=2 Tax=Granulicella aggregans TaxID=474949 RepID=A0A7W7ZK16_9BACT|nr:hypothetical protein [Granulicella aggregans]